MASKTKTPAKYSADLSRQLRERFGWSSHIRLAAFPLCFGVPDLMLAVIRLSGIGRLYRIETGFIMLHAISAMVAIVAIVLRRPWYFFAFGAWMAIAVFRLLVVGHLQ